MARMEKSEPLQGAMAPRQGQIVRGAGGVVWRPHTRGVFCCAVPLVLLLGILFYVSWIAAATGLVRIPVISGFAYERPQAPRSVFPGNPIERSFERMILTKSETLDLSERDLTASVQNILRASSFPSIDDQNTFVLVEKTGVVAYLPVKDNPQQTMWRVELFPSLTEGELSLTVGRVTIGSQSVPALFYRSMVDRAMAQSLSPFNQSIRDKILLTDLTLTPGVVRVSGKVL